MIYGTRVKKPVDIDEFCQKVQKYSEEKIECTPHSFFRFSEEQRKEFNCDFAKNFILNKRPVFVGLQYNGNYAAFYEYADNRLLKVIIIFIVGKIRVITFYAIEKEQLPRL